MIRRCLITLAAAMAAGQAANAQEVRTNRPTPICTSPRAASALNNMADPRRSDPNWTAFVAADGGCANLDVDVHVSLVQPFGELSQVEYPPHSGTMRYIITSALTPDPSPVAVGIDPVPAWQVASSGFGPSAICELSGKAGTGILTLNAQADHAGMVRILLVKPTWRMPEDAPVRAIVTFSDQTKIALSGVGRGDHVVFELKDNLRQWVHEFTAAKSGVIAFAAGSDQPWRLDLAGTSAAVTGMAECIRTSNMSNVPPPFTLDPKLLATVGSYSSTGPSSQPVTPVPEPLLPVVPSMLPKTLEASRPPLETVLIRWSGSGMMTTRPFHVPGPWELRWHSAPGFFSANLHTIGVEHTDMLALQGKSGDSSAYRPEGGTFYLDFSASADWSAEVVVLPDLQPNMNTQEPAVPQVRSPASDPEILPQTDTQATCERASVSHDPTAIKMCVNHEQLAYMILQADWNQKSPEVRRKCLARITAATSFPNTYLLTCVEGGAP